MSSILDDEEPKPKISVKIKPISELQKDSSDRGSGSTAFSGSVDELRTFAGLAPPPTVVSVGLSCLMQAVWVHYLTVPLHHIVCIHCSPK